jgi:phosphoribosylformylglycinamidine synthase
LKARIHVTLKRGILDPQGKAIEHALGTLGYKAVGNVRVGKHIELDVDESAVEDVAAQVKAMCEKLLANTIIEDYSYELETDKLKPVPKAAADPVVEITASGAPPAEPWPLAERSDPPEQESPTDTLGSFASLGQRARAWATAVAKPMEDAQAHEEARRLAHRIMSDLALLNQQMIDEGIRNGTLRDLLKDDLEEGLKLYRQQVPESVRTQKDYYGEAIEVFINERKASLGLA